MSFNTIAYLDKSLERPLPSIADTSDYNTALNTLISAIEMDTNRCNERTRLAAHHNPRTITIRPQALRNYVSAHLVLNDGVYYFKGTNRYIEELWPLSAVSKIANYVKFHMHPNIWDKLMAMLMIEYPKRWSKDIISY